MEKKQSQPLSAKEEIKEGAKPEDSQSESSHEQESSGANQSQTEKKLNDEFAYN